MISNSCIGNKERPTSSNLEELNLWIEDGFVCGNNVSVSKIYNQCKI